MTPNQRFKMKVDGVQRTITITGPAARQLAESPHLTAVGRRVFILAH